MCVDLLTLCSLCSVSFGNGNAERMGIDSQSSDLINEYVCMDVLDGHGNDVERKLGFEWECGTHFCSPVVCAQNTALI